MKRADRSMRSAKPSVAELRAVCQPPELLARYSAEHWAGRLYGRKVSIYLTWLFVRAGVSANAITLGMIGVGLAGAWLFSVRGSWTPVAAVALIQLYLVLDCSDGEVARWSGTTGAIGIYLDRLGHYLVEASLFAAIGARGPFWPAPITQDDATAFEILLDAGNLAILGFAVALVHLVGKVETDLVHVARAKAGLRAGDDAEEVSLPRASGLARARRAARLLPLYRLTGAVEASAIGAVFALMSEATGDRVWLLGFLQGALVVTAFVALGHLVMILASNRLR